MIPQPWDAWSLTGTLVLVLMLTRGQHDKWMCCKCWKSVASAEKGKSTSSQHCGREGSRCFFHGPWLAPTCPRRN